jgi:hypothetical protein
MGHLARYTSTFVDTGENLGLRPFAIQEHERLMAQAPPWVPVLKPAWKILHRLRRLAHGQYAPRPFAYDIYTPASPARRVHVEVAKPTFYWAARMK